MSSRYGTTLRLDVLALLPGSAQGSMEDGMSSLGDKLRSARLTRGATIAEVARIGGVQERAISRVEGGTRPDPWRLAALARGYDLPLDEVVGDYIADMPADQRRGLVEFSRSLVSVTPLEGDAGERAVERLADEVRGERQRIRKARGQAS